jgi:hypothetical protein
MSSEFDPAIDRALQAQEFAKKASQREAKLDLAESYSPFVSSPYYQRPSFGDMAKVMDFESQPEPANPIEALSQAGGVESVEVPEITPVFLGLRAAINERRLERAEKAHQKAIKGAVSAAYTGRVLRRTKFTEGYLQDSDDPLLRPPSTVREKITTARLERRSEKRYKAIGESSHLDTHFDDEEKPVKRTWHEGRKAAHESAHDKIIRKKTGKVLKLSAKAQRLSAKQEAIRSKIEEREARRRPEAPEERQLDPAIQARLDRLNALLEDD